MAYYQLQMQRAHHSKASPKNLCKTLNPIRAPKHQKMYMPMKNFKDHFYGLVRKKWHESTLGRHCFQLANDKKQVSLRQYGNAKLWELLSTKQLQLIWLPSLQRTPDQVGIKPHTLTKFGDSGFCNSNWSLFKLWCR